MTDHQVPSLDERRAATEAIAAWGRTARMSDQTAGDIFAAIIATPAPGWAGDAEPDEEPDTPIGARWWRRQAADLAATMIRSTRWVPAA